MLMLPSVPSFLLELLSTFLSTTKFSTAATFDHLIGVAIQEVYVDPIFAFHA